MLTNILPILIDILLQEGFTMTTDEIGDFILISRAIMADTPLREDSEAWKAETLKNNPDKVKELLGEIQEIFS